jgi:hypothetical protein
MKGYLQSNEKEHRDIITRDCQRALWKEALRIMKDKTDSHDHILVTGSPGIGKSRSMAFFLRLLLEKGETVVYHAEKENKFILFKPKLKEGGGEDEGNVVYEAMEASDVSPSKIEELKNPDNFYLIDPSETMNDPVEVEAHSLMVSSPKLERYKGFADKRPGQTTKLYMPDAEKAEVVAMRSILAPKTTEKDVEGWFHDFGGRLRTVFASAEDREGEVKSIINTVRNMDLKLLRSLILNEVDDLEAPSSRKRGVPMSNICGYTSIAPFTKSNRKIILISELVEEKLFDAYGQNLWDMYDSLPATIKALFFEKFSLNKIAEGNIEFRCTKWVYLGGENKKKQWGEPEHSKVMFSAKELKKELSLKGNLKVVDSLCHSFNKSEALIDGSSAEGTFQMTIGENHQNSRRGAQVVTDGWGATPENKMPLYYCVPNDVYDVWSKKKKPPLFDDKKEPEGWKGDDAMYAKIDFFVLEIEMTPDVLAQFYAPPN